MSHRTYKEHLQTQRSRYNYKQTVYNAISKQDYAKKTAFQNRCALFANGFERRKQIKKLISILNCEVTERA